MKNKTKKTFSWKLAGLLFLGVGLLTVGLSVFVQAQSRNIVQNYFIEDFKPISATPIAMGLGSTAETPARPARLIIPRIGVDAVIQGVGQNIKGEMDIPTNIVDVAWYNQGPFPGTSGSAVIAGHLNGRRNSSGVFRNISMLKSGDIIKVIDQKGNELQFQVIEIKTYDYNASASEVFLSDNTKARLNLITCAGDWIKSQNIYNKRTVVFTEFIKSN